MNQQLALLLEAPHVCLHCTPKRSRMTSPRPVAFPPSIRLAVPSQGKGAYAANPACGTLPPSSNQRKKRSSKERFKHQHFSPIGPRPLTAGTPALFHIEPPEFTHQPVGPRGHRPVSEDAARRTGTASFSGRAPENRPATCNRPQRPRKLRRRPSRGIP